MKFSLKLLRAAMILAVITLPTCAATTCSKMVASEHVIVGQKGF